MAAVLGVTSTATRDDPARLLVGQAVFYFLESRFSRNPIPHGASSFFVMRREAAEVVGNLAFGAGNVGAVMAALGMRMATVSYVKPKSYRDDSRFGLSGHVTEAVGSLALTGVLSRFATTGATAAALAAAGPGRSRGPLRWSAMTAAAAMAGGVVAAERFNRQHPQGPRSACSSYL